MIDSISNSLQTALSMEVERAEMVAQIVAVFLLVALAVLANALAKGFIKSSLSRLIKKTKTDWDDLILENKNEFNYFFIVLLRTYFQKALVLYCSGHSSQ